MPTKQELRNEIVRCGRDPAYFIRKYVKIQHPKRGLISFDLFDYQERLIDAYMTERFNVILKARQLGISEVTAAYAAWLMLFHRDKNVLVMATKADTAKNIVRKIKVCIKKLPKWLMLTRQKTDNAMSIEFDNGSRIQAIASSGDAGRSEALSLLIIDEAAHVTSLDEMWTGLLPTVTAGGSVIMLSTPNGVGNLFHKIYTEAEAHENDFHPTKLMWWVHPERIEGLCDDPDRPGFKTSVWFRKEIESANVSERDRAQEYECSFLSSGDNVFAGAILAAIELGIYTPPSIREEDRNLFVWMEPRERGRYLIACDVARGDGKDFSTAQVFDVESMDQVAEYCGKIPPDRFAKLLNDLGKDYNNAMLVVENNAVGMAALEHLKLFGYCNLFYSRKGDQMPGEFVNCSYEQYETDLIAGFTTTSKTRLPMINKLEEYLRKKQMNIHSKRTLEEFRTFIWNSARRPEAMRGYNDDLTMACALAVWIRDTVLSSSHVSAEIQEKLVLGIDQMVTRNVDIPGATKMPGHQQVRTPMLTRPERQRPEMQLPNGMIVDFSWIYKG